MSVETDRPRLPPELAPFALFLARRVGATRIAVLGSAIDFARLRVPPAIRVVELEDGAAGGAGTSAPDANPTPPSPAPDGLIPSEGGGTVVVAYLPTEAPEERVLSRLLHLSARARFTVLATGAGDRDRWAEALTARGAAPAFAGRTRADRRTGSPRDVGVLILEDPFHPLTRSGPITPENWRAVAFVVVFNEADILGPALEDLLDQGIAPYVIDNWSTDDSYRIARRYLDTGVVAVERHPAPAPAAHFDLGAVLRRIERLTGTLEADWYLKHDADEIRRSPWPGTTMRDALFRVQASGYNCVDFTVLNFPPVDDSFTSGTNPVGHFRHFEFGSNRAHFRQLKAWQNTLAPVDLAATAGHEVRFPGRRVFPYKFLLHHYPVRSQPHGERKVFAERLGRFLPEARRRGWHRHYDSIVPGHRFTRDPQTLIEMDEASFAEEYLIERLSGVGLPRQPARSHPSA